MPAISSTAAVPFLTSFLLNPPSKKSFYRVVFLGGGGGGGTGCGTGDVGMGGEGLVCCIGARVL